MKLVFYKIILFTVFSCIFFQCHGKGNQKAVNISELSDSEKFALEYPLVGSDNVFIYRNASEAADILEHGRGIVFIGYKECPWCQQYAVYLHDAAREMEVEKIYYLS